MDEQEDNSLEIYSRAADDALGKLQAAIFDKLELDAFDWVLLINLIIEEDSPLQDLFGREVSNLAALSHQSMQTLFAAQKAMGLIEEEVVKEVHEALDSKDDDDDFASFESME